ncbi:MAG: hypothetical protein ACJ73E_08850 [Mycobacteriales bacterium]
MVVGSGSLARSVCFSLAMTSTAPLAVTVLARSAARAAEVGYVAGTAARLTGRPVTVAAAAVDLRSGELADALAELGPAAVLVLASAHSPWERRTRPSAWTELLDRAGFGVTLPLQAAVAAEVGRAVAAACPAALLLNGCFPDAVNPLLTALGIPVHCGIGNAAILAASLQAGLALPDQRDLAVLAHHVHLHEPEDPDDEALAWVGGTPVEKVGALLAAQRATDPQVVNQVTGLTAALLLRGVLAGTEVPAVLPGPLGLPGGYPVLVRGAALSLRLPPGVDRAAAVAWNQRMAERDGVRVEADRVAFAPAAAEALAPYLPELAAGFAVRDTPAVTETLLALRTRLRALGPSNQRTGPEDHR